MAHKSENLIDIGRVKMICRSCEKTISEPWIGILGDNKDPEIVFSYCTKDCLKAQKKKDEDLFNQIQQ